MVREINLDLDTFKALAGETRVEILKSLKERKKYLAELSEELEMSNSSVKEHMETLTESGLVEKEDNGRKWKYYKLTDKGSKIMSEKSTKAYIMLGLSIFASVTGGLLFIKNQILMKTAAGASGINQSLYENAPKLTEKSMGSASAEGTVNQTVTTASKAIDYSSPEFILMFIGIVSLALTIFWIVKRRYMK